jgi:hypothetical protein
MSWPPRLMGLWAFIDLTINLVEAQKKPTPTRKKGIIYFIYSFWKNILSFQNLAKLTYDHRNL